VCVPVEYDLFDPEVHAREGAADIGRLSLQGLPAPDVRQRRPVIDQIGGVELIQSPQIPLVIGSLHRSTDSGLGLLC
jgi:hypothetical protein